MVMVLDGKGHFSTDLPDPNEDPAEIMKKLCRECGEPELAEEIEAKKDKKNLVSDWFDRHISTFGQKKLGDGRTIAEKVLGIRRKLENMKDFEIEKGVLIEYKGKDANVVIPDGVKEIIWENQPFYNCSELISIFIPDSVIKLDCGVFDGFTSMTSINVSPKNKNYKSIDGILYNADASVLIRCPEGKSSSVTIPNSVNIIESCAFAGCDRLTSIVIPDSVTEIEENAFEDCTSLTTITIPDFVTDIEYTLDGCKALKQINVSQTNKHYRTIDGVLYNADASVLIKCPNGITSSVIIPDSVKEIADCAFSDCVGLTSIIIPDSVTEIGEYAFSGCRNLTAITIPDSVETMGEGAFSGCCGLKSV